MVHFLLRFLTMTLTVLLFLTLLFVLQVVFPPLGNSNHVVVSVSSDFPSNSGRDASFHCTAYDYFYADWGGLHDHLRETKWQHIKLGVSAVHEYCEWVQVGIEVHVSQCKYLVSFISMVFSCFCCYHILQKLLNTY